jgi:hypothetical protein
MDTELEAMAARMEVTADQLRNQLAQAGRTAAVRAEQRKAKALTWLLDHVEVVDEEGNPVAREALAVDQSLEGDGDGTGGPSGRVDQGDGMDEPEDDEPENDETDPTGEADG